MASPPAEQHLGRKAWKRPHSTRGRALARSRPPARRAFLVPSTLPAVREAGGLKPGEGTIRIRLRPGLTPRVANRHRGLHGRVFLQMKGYAFGGSQRAVTWVLSWPGRPEVPGVRRQAGQQRPQRAGSGEPGADDRGEQQTGEAGRPGCQPVGDRTTGQLPDASADAELPGGRTVRIAVVRSY